MTEAITETYLRLEKQARAANPPASLLCPSDVMHCLRQTALLHGASVDEARYLIRWNTEAN